jgi:hypothetical protein
MNLHLQMQLQTWIQQRSASLTTQKVSFQWGHCLEKDKI